jgi:hypothetical protein
VTRRLVLGFILASALPAFPQDASPARERHSRDDAFKMVDAYLVSNLQESLALSDEQFVKLLPLVKRLQTDRRELAVRRKRALGDMHRLLENGSATEARLRELLDEIRAVEEGEATTIRRDMQAIDAALDPIQQAKYRVLEGKVEQRIREAVAHARQERAQSRAPREP